MAIDYIPSADTALLTWAGQYNTVFGAAPVSYGFVAADATALATLVTGFATVLNDNEVQQTAARAARAAKDTGRAALVASLRSLSQRIQLNPAVTDAQKVALGLPLRDAVLSAAATPTIRPLLTVDTSERLRHTISFFESATRRGKPAGARAAEIWVSVGTAPTFDGAGNPTNMEFLALDTATPYLAQYATADGGKVAYYVARWAGSGEERGPWSETVEATVVA